MRTPSDQKKDIARIIAFENQECLFFPKMLSKEFQIPNHLAVQLLIEAGLNLFKINEDIRKLILIHYRLGNIRIQNYTKSNLV